MLLTFGRMSVECGLITDFIDEYEEAIFLIRGDCGCCGVFFL